MDKEKLRKLYICSHVWTKELTEKYKDISYKAQFSLCIKELVKQKKEGKHNLF